jgi:hypothetical protein
MTVTNGGDTIIAAMEGALSGDTDATLHRFLTYNKDRAATGRWSSSATTPQHSTGSDGEDSA